LWPNQDELVSKITYRFAGQHEQAEKYCNEDEEFVAKVESTHSSKYLHWHCCHVDLVIDPRGM